MHLRCICGALAVRLRCISDARLVRFICERRRRQLGRVRGTRVPSTDGRHMCRSLSSRRACATRARYGTHMCARTAPRHVGPFAHGAPDAARICGESLIRPCRAASKNIPHGCTVGECDTARSHSGAYTARLHADPDSAYLTSSLIRLVLAALTDRRLVPSEPETLGSWSMCAGHGAFTRRA